MDAAGGHAFALPIEAVADGGLGVDVAWFEGGELLPIGEGDGPKGFGVMGDADFVTELPLGHDFYVAFADLISLGVEAGGKEEKRGMGEGESVASFVDAAFAKEDGLAAAGKGVANDLPFFESGRHGEVRAEGL